MKIFAFALLCFWHGGNNGGSNAHRLDLFLHRLKTLHEHLVQQPHWNMPNPVPPLMQQMPGPTMYEKDPQTGLMYSITQGRIYDPTLHFAVDLKKDILYDWESGRQYPFSEVLRSPHGVVKPKLIR